MSKTVCDVIVDMLAEAGVGHIFGIPGDAINSLIDSLRRRQAVRFVQVRHEESGAFAASAAAKLTGRLAVCCGTAGPGAIHLLNGLYDASTDKAPVLAITGQVETIKMGHNSHQEVDLEALFDDVAVYNETITNPAQTARMMAAAIQAAVSRCGVAHISIPADIAGQKIDGSGYPVFDHRAVVTPPAEDLARAAEVLNGAKRVAIFAGIGALGARQSLLAAAEKLAAPVVHTLRAKELLAHDHPLNIGGLGMLGGRPGVEAVGDCDALLMIGTDFPYREFLPDAIPVVQIERNPEHLGRRCRLAVGLAGDSAATLEALLPHLDGGRDIAFLERAQRHREHELKRYATSENKHSSPLSPQRVARRVGELAADGTIFTCDTGEVTVWAARHLPIRDGQRFTLSGTLASMAFAMPAAIGAQVVCGERPVVGLCGDGGFSMLMGEVLTAVKYRLPLTLVIFNNRKLGLIQAEQESDGLPEYAVGLQTPSYAEIARSCGALGFSVESDSELDEALSEALASDRPAVVDVQVDPEALPFPPHVHIRQAFNFSLAKLRELFADTDE